MIRLKFFLLGLILIFVLRFLFSFRSGADPEPAYERISLETVDGVDCLVWQGSRYYAYCGVDLEDGTVWDWHGRMGKGLGVLIRSDGVPVGDLYTLRENDGDFLLADLPQDGWPITDMQIFVKEGAALPEISAEGFFFGEVYSISGEFTEEEWEKVCDIVEPSHVQALAKAWLSGASVSVPEGEYQPYRVRLHWGEIPGLYVTFLLNVNQEQGEAFLEKFHSDQNLGLKIIILKNIEYGRDGNLFIEINKQGY